jgi:hypothetical protein
MAVEKISVSLPDYVAARARRAAERAGLPLSTWLAEAAEAAADLDEMRAALAEYEAMYGPPDPEAAAIMDAKLAEAGVFEPVPPEVHAANQAALARLRGFPEERRTG